MVQGGWACGCGSVNSGIVQCVSVAGVLGNTTVDVSLNGQEFTASGLLVENIVLANVTSVMPGWCGASDWWVIGGGAWAGPVGMVLSSSSVRCGACAWCVHWRLL